MRARLIGGVLMQESWLGDHWLAHPRTSELAKELPDLRCLMAKQSSLAVHASIGGLVLTRSVALGTLYSETVLQSTTQRCSSLNGAPRRVDLRGASRSNHNAPLPPRRDA